MKDSAWYVRDYWYWQRDTWYLRLQAMGNVARAVPSVGKQGLGMGIRAIWKLGVLIRNALYALGVIGAGFLITLYEPDKGPASMMRAIILLTVIWWYGRRTRREWIRISPPKQCAKAHKPPAPTAASRVQMPTAPDMAQLAPPARVKRKRKARVGAVVSEAARCATEAQLLQQFVSGSDPI